VDGHAIVPEGELQLQTAAYQDYDGVLDLHERDPAFKYNIFRSIFIIANNIKLN
jgi:hypothetical protein